VAQQRLTNKLLLDRLIFEIKANRAMMLPILRFQSLCLLVLSLAAFVRPFSPASTTSSFSRRSVTSLSPSSSSTTTTLRMAVDYNNPDVAEEFGKVQFMDYDDVVKELRGKGAAVSASMKYV
jgi:hypothetical protein